ncbi:MAG: hypothetical protein IPK76_16170 [Lewinellaceae bacterium]|nr:hypothetical protein [Lewinellaceae bacterium]
MTPEQYLIITGSAIFLVLGTIHLVYTFFSDKFLARQSETVERMKADVPVLTRQTTMWNAWVGFNASHSSGAMFIGLVNIILAVEHFDVLHNSLPLQLLDVSTMAFYLFLAKRYWFSIPLRGIALAAVCFLLSFILVWSR